MASFINQNICNRLNLEKKIQHLVVSMASSTRQCISSSFITTDFILENRSYKKQHFNVLESLCTDVIFGQDFFKQHNSIEFQYGGEMNKLTFLYKCCTTKNISVN